MKITNPYATQTTRLRADLRATEWQAEIWEWLYAHGVHLPLIEQVISGRRWEWITGSGEFTHPQIREFEGLVKELESARIERLLV